MSHYEITDDGKLIHIRCPDGCMETLQPTEPDAGVYLDDIVIAAIRQQQSDLAALTAERDKLRARLAAIDAAPTVGLGCYDAGLLNNYGGGNVAWWWDYIRAELERAHDYYRDQAHGLIARPEKDAP